MDRHPLQMPPLSDEAAVEIHDFLQVILLRFEACYGGEIYRYYEQRSRHNIREPERPHHTDPPF